MEANYFKISRFIFFILFGVINNCFAENYQKKLLIPSSITSISITGVFDIDISVSPTLKGTAILETDKINVEKVSFVLRNNSLFIDSNNLVSNQSVKLALNVPVLSTYYVNGATKTKIYINQRSIPLNVKIDGASSFYGEGELQKLNLNTFGTSEVYLNKLNLKEIELDIRDISNIYLNQRAKILRKETSGLATVIVSD